MRSRRLSWLLLPLALLSSCGKQPTHRGETVRLATTTSVKDSGLLAVLVPAFEQQTGYRVEVSAVGSGKAIEMLAAGAADVAITHAPEDETAALAAHRIAQRTPFMHNDFVIVGPAEGAATVAGAGDVRAALRRIAASGGRFISRGDGSGTHQREQKLWQAAGIPADSAFIAPAKSGMGATLALAARQRAYTLTDRGTYLAKRKELDLVILFEGGDELVNRYSVLEPVGGGKGARALVELVRSPEGRRLIGGFGVKERGEPLFTPEP